MIIVELDGNRYVCDPVRTTTEDIEKAKQFDDYVSAVTYTDTFFSRVVDIKYLEVI